LNLLSNAIKYNRVDSEACRDTMALQKEDVMRTEGLYKARILILDDQRPNVQLLGRILQQAGYTAVAGITDPLQVLTLFEAFQPDLILVDLHMPVMDGFAVMEALSRRIPTGTYLPILVITADITPETKRRALSAGARDFLSKPFDTTEVLLRIKNLLETRLLQLQLQNQNQELETKVRERTRELEQAQIEILQRLAQAAEFRDDDTGQHTQRVGRLAALLAEMLGLPKERVELIRLTAPLHDIGKIGIPDRLLLKPGRFTGEEFEDMKAHADIGARILSGSQHTLLRMAEEIAHTHHERWDGSGYPQGLANVAIPLTGRIVAVADAFDALTHERPYKHAWPVAEALDEIARQSGEKFDPYVVEALLRLYRHEDPPGRQQDLALKFRMEPESIETVDVFGQDSAALM
jgi:putative two-component system response regulator